MWRKKLKKLRKRYYWRFHHLQFCCKHSWALNPVNKNVHFCHFRLGVKNVWAWLAGKWKCRVHSHNFDLNYIKSAHIQSPLLLYNFKAFNIGAVQPFFKIMYDFYMFSYNLFWFLRRRKFAVVFFIELGTCQVRFQNLHSFLFIGGNLQGRHQSVL